MFVDAVHFAPHGLIDVKELDCDFLVCSPYKFFGPHMGTLYGKREHLLRFKPFKVRPAPETLPDRWETGTQVQELIAGIAAAVDYLAELGRHCDAAVKGRREALRAAYRATHRHEMELFVRLVQELQETRGVRIFGITDPQRFEERCSTLSFRLGNHNPTEIATFLGERGIFTRRRTPLSDVVEVSSIGVCGDLAAVLIASSAARASWPTNSLVPSTIICGV